jgi:hypothetical protein
LAGVSTCSLTGTDRRGVTWRKGVVSAGALAVRRIALTFSLMLVENAFDHIDHFIQVT